MEGLGVSGVIFNHHLLSIYAHALLGLGKSKVNKNYSCLEEAYSCDEESPAKALFTT